MRWVTTRRPKPLSNTAFLWLALILLLIAFCLMGCTAEKAYFVPPGVPVRLGQEVRGVRVFVPDSSGSLIAATASLYPGMWITVDPQEWPLPEREAHMNIKRTP